MATQSGNGWGATASIFGEDQRGSFLKHCPYKVKPSGREEGDVFLAHDAGLRHVALKLLPAQFAQDKDRLRRRRRLRCLGAESSKYPHTTKSDKLIRSFHSGRVIEGETLRTHARREADRTRGTDIAIQIAAVAAQAGIVHATSPENIMLYEIVCGCLTLNWKITHGPHHRRCTHRRKFDHSSSTLMGPSL
jgi:hypothetical protein